MKFLWKLFRTTLWIVVILAVMSVGWKFVTGGGPDREYGMAMERQAAAIEQQAQAMARQAEAQAFAIERGVQENIRNWQQQMPPMPPMPPMHEEQVMYGEFDPHTYERNHHNDFGIGGGVFMTLVMLIAGAVLLAKGGRKAKIVGGILIGIVLLPWLFALLSLLVPVALIFLVWRYLRRKDKQVAFATSQGEYNTASSYDYLDEWEQKTMRNRKGDN